MRNTKQIEAEAKAFLANHSLPALVEIFELSETLTMTDALAISRGWLMDALEARDPSAFAAWMDANESSPRQFFVRR